MKIRKIITAIGVILSLIFISVILTVCILWSHLYLTSNSPFLFISGIFILFIPMALFYFFFKDEVLPFIKNWREKKRLSRSVKTIKTVIRSEREEEKEIKPRIEPLKITETYDESSIEQGSVKGQVMKELGLSYEKPKKLKAVKKPIISSDFSKRDNRILQRKRLSFLGSSGIAALLLKQGEIEISDNLHIGQVRGAEITNKIIKPALRDIGAEFKITDQGTRVLLTERGRRKLREEIEKLKKG